MCVCVVVGGLFCLEVVLGVAVEDELADGDQGVVAVRPHLHTHTQTLSLSLSLSVCVCACVWLLTLVMSKTFHL